jgi:nickel transport protein
VAPRHPLSGFLPLAALAAALLLPPSAALAHSVGSTVESGHAFTVSFHYDDGSPVTDCGFEVFDPAMGQPYQTGRTDRLGRVAFRPDRPGLWQVRVWTEDGHGSTAQVEVDATLSLATPQAAPVSRLPKIITGVAVLFGLFGVLALVQSRSGSRSRAHS